MTPEERSEAVQALRAAARVLASKIVWRSKPDARQQQMLRKSKQDLQKEAEDQGFYTTYKVVDIPLNKIVHQDVWKPDRYERAHAGLSAGKALPPIEVALQGGKYHISDGIHRYNATKDLGYTHVPAIVGTTIDTPDQMKKYQDKGLFKQKDVVYVHDTNTWAMIDEFLTKGSDGRRRYSLVGVPRGAKEAEVMGDFWDSEFDRVRMRTPSHILKMLNEWWGW